MRESRAQFADLRTDSAADSDAARAWWDAGVLAGSVIYLYSNLFTLSGRPFLLGGDQTFFWMNAQRMLHGEQIYRDFFQFTPPGTDLVYLSLFRIFGQRIWVTNGAVLVLGVALCWLCFRISALLMERSRAALAGALFVVVIYGKLLNGTHHWFSVLAVLAAVALIMRKATPARFAIAGVLLGAASFFTQTRGVIAAVAVVAYFLWKHFGDREQWQECMKYIAWLFIPLVTWVALSGYCIARTGLRQILYFQVTYVSRYMVTGWRSLGLPEALTWKNLPGAAQYPLVYVMISTIYTFCLWRCWKARRDRRSMKNQRTMLLTFIGLGMCIEVAQSPNWLRVYCVAAPAIILLVAILPASGRFWVQATRLMWLGVIGLALSQTWSRHRHQGTILRLPAGETAVVPASAEKLEWLAQHTRPGEEFFQAAWPGLYLPLQLRNPVFLDTLEWGNQTRPEYVDRSIRQLEAKQVRYILWSPHLNYPGPAPGARGVSFGRLPRFPDEPISARAGFFRSR
jgi:hypothetical protein